MTRPVLPTTPPTASRPASWRRLAYDDARLLGAGLGFAVAALVYPFDPLAGGWAFVVGVVVAVLPAALVREDG